MNCLASVRLSIALDDADPEAQRITEILDSIPGAWERTQRPPLRSPVGPSTASVATVAIARIAERDLDELISSRQLIAAYAYEEALGRVTVLAFHDARSAGVAIEER